MKAKIKNAISAGIKKVKDKNLSKNLNDKENSKLKKMFASKNC